MEKEKNREHGTGKDSDFTSESAATRARNRTVMLTPEITGQVRARLAQETDEGEDNGTSSGAFNTDALESARGSSGGFKLSQEPPAYQGAYSPAAAPNSPVQSAPKAPAQQFPPAATGSAVGNVVWNKITPLVGFLVTFDNNENGEVYELRSGRLIISSEPASGWSYMVVEDPSVSPMHAILRIDNTGIVQVLDQLSEFGTRIRRFGSQEEEQISGEKSTIEHGDVIKFGERTFHVCILALNNE